MKNLWGREYKMGRVLLPAWQLYLLAGDLSSSPWLALIIAGHSLLGLPLEEEDGLGT